MFGHFCLKLLGLWYTRVMLDKRTRKLLDLILRVCGEDGSYKIIEIHDLIKGMLPKYKIDSEIFGQMMKFLVGMELIDIKYTDESVTCVAILPKGRIYEESKAEKRHNRAIGKGIAILIIVGSFLAAMAGAFLANILLYTVG